MEEGGEQFWNAVSPLPLPISGDMALLALRRSARIAPTTAPTEGANNITRRTTG